MKSVAVAHSIERKVVDWGPTLLLAALAVVTARTYLLGLAGPRALAPFHIVVLLIAALTAPLLSGAVRFLLALVAILAATALTFTTFGAASGWCDGCSNASKMAMGVLLATNFCLSASLVISPLCPVCKIASRVFCLAVPAVQCVLVVASPRLCPPCVTTGFAAIATYFATEWEAPASRRISVYAAIAVLFGLGSRLVKYSSPPSPPKGVIARSLVGNTLRIPGIKLEAGDLSVLLLTAPGCGWCNKARAWLKHHREHYIEINLQQDGVTTAGLNPANAPQLLCVSGSRVTNHIFGYDAKAYTAIFH